GRGKIHVALKPRFDRMLIGRQDVSEMVRHEGTYVPGDDVLQHVLVHGSTPMHQPTTPHEEDDKGHSHYYTRPAPGPPHGTGVSATGTADCSPYLLVQGRWWCEIQCPRPQRCPQCALGLIRLRA